MNESLSEEVPHILAKDSWRIFRIISEFVEGFETMTKLGPSVSIFGSARLPQSSPYYQMAAEVSKRVCQKGFAIITGGGPGIMEAANYGAQSASKASCGLTIDLPFEEEANYFVDPLYRLRFRYFFVRKVMFIRYAQGFVFLPGGFGTMDELFEALTLIQTTKIRSFPIYLMGKEYWTGLFDWIRERAVKIGCISAQELELVHFTDDPQEVAEGIELHYKTHQAGLNF